MEETHPRHMRSLTPCDEIDRDGNALERKTVAHPVLHPVRVVARDEARIVDEEAVARRAYARLRPVQEVESLAAPRRRLAILADIGGTLWWLFHGRIATWHELADSTVEITAYSCSAALAQDPGAEIAPRPAVDLDALVDELDGGAR